MKDEDGGPFLPGEAPPNNSVKRNYKKRKQAMSVTPHISSAAFLEVELVLILFALIVLYMLRTQTFLLPPPASSTSSIATIRPSAQCTQTTPNPTPASVMMGLDVLSDGHGGRSVVLYPILLPKAVGSATAHACLYLSLDTQRRSHRPDSYASVSPSVSGRQDGHGAEQAGGGDDGDQHL